MPDRKLPKGAPGGVSASSLAAMPTAPSEAHADEHPRVTINGVAYEWGPGQEASVPAEAVEVWRRSREANA